MSDGEPLAPLLERLGELETTHRLISHRRLAEEGLERARAQGDLRGLLELLDRLQNHSIMTLDPRYRKQRAIELIGLLESEKLARAVDPQLSDDEWERWRRVLLACSYLGLAGSEAFLQGYNSAGLQEAVHEGMLKARAGGDPQDVILFREQAVYVLVAAGDLDLAAIRARALGTEENHPDYDQRGVVGYIELGNICILRGDLPGALAAFHRAHELSGGFHDPTVVRHDIRCRLELLYTLLERREEWEALAARLPALELPPRGECPCFDWELDRRDAVLASLAGRHAEAIASYRRWWAFFAERENFSRWLDEGVRLAAALRLADQDEEARAVAEQVRERARPARNWITLQQLDALFDPTHPPNPLAPIGAVVREALRPAPLGGASPPEEPPRQAGEEEASPDAAPQAEPPPWLEEYRAWRARLPEEAGAVASEMLALPAGSLDGDEARTWLKLAVALATQGVAGERLWRRARLLLRGDATPAPVLAWGALLGTVLRGDPRRGEPQAGAPADDEVDALFRRALDTDPQDPWIHAQAGSFYSSRGQESEAERCFARASCLDRSWPEPALRLAAIYSQSDRARDAVDLLDLVLRHGGRDPQVAWEAGQGAFHTGQFARAEQYLALAKELEPKLRWADYYRALAFLERNRGPEAVTCIEAELEENSDVLLSAHAVRALAAQRAGDSAGAARWLEEALGVPLVAAGSLSPRGLGRTLELLEEAAPSPELHAQVVTRALRAGLVPGRVLEAERLREDNPERTGLTLFAVSFVQPCPAEGLDVPPWELGWEAYRVTWGILAGDAEEAVDLARGIQARCAEAAPTLAKVQQADGGYRDRSGVVFQQRRARVEG